MLGFLQDIFEAIEDIPDYFAYAIEGVINLLFEGLTDLLEAAAGVLPGLPEIFAPPSFLTDINWYFPLGAVLAIAGPLTTAYVVFLGVRWLYKKYGTL